MLLHASVFGILELFGTARGEQRVDELVQIAVHHGVELI